MTGQRRLVLVLVRVRDDGRPPGRVDGERQRPQQHPEPGRQLVWQRLIFLSPFESTKVDSHPNPLVNDAKVNLAARRSLAAWRIRRRSRGEKGARRGGFGPGGGEGKKGKKNGWVCGASDSKWPAAASEGGGGLASLGGWAQWATVALAGARRWGEGPGQFFASGLWPCGHDGGPTTGWTGTSGHRPEESTRDLWAKDGWMDVRLGIKNGSLDEGQGLRLRDTYRCTDVLCSTYRVPT